MLSNSILFTLLIVLSISDFIQSNLYFRLKRRVERLEDKIDILENLRN